MSSGAIAAIRSRDDRVGVRRAARAQVGQRDRALGLAGQHDDVLELGQRAADRGDLRRLRGVLDAARTFAPECESTYSHSSGEFVW